MRSKILLSAIFLSIQWSLHLLNASSITPTQLTCEYIDNPSVIDVLHPRLSWINEANGNQKGVSQSAYEVEVATEYEKLLQGKPDLWKTKKVNSDASVLISYNGKDLNSRTDCWWRVRVWDNKGKVSTWSEPAYWHVGLLNKSDWKAEWIGAPWQGERPVTYNTDELPHPAPLLRKSFSVEKTIKSAKIYTTGLGYFELYCNGRKVSDDVLVPNQTQWTKRENLHEYGIPVHDDFTEYCVLYLCYDLKPLLHQGKNAIGAILGNGFYSASSRWVLGYGSPRFIAQLEIEYVDGSKETIISDTDWKVEKSPIVYDMIYQGEQYDARLEYKDWCKAEYNDDNWKNAIIRNAPVGQLQAQMSPSDKVMEKLKPVNIEKLDGKGNYRIDFGEEISGWLRMDNINGVSGHRIRIKYLSESANGTNSYTLNGSKDESYATRFTWYVFRSVEIYDYPGELKAEDITAEAVYTDVKTVGHFNCSNELLNKIQKIWKRSQTDNMHGGIASDCPHRERLAYTGDGQVAMNTVMHNYDVASFYRKWIKDIVGSQNITTGYVPNSAPWQPGAGGGVAWGASIVIMPWEYYQTYGDLQILSYSYEGMKKYLAYMQQWLDDDGIMFQQAPSKDNVQYWMNLGEWCPPGEFPPNELVHTFYLWLCTHNIANSASALGKNEDARMYRQQEAQVKEAFIKRFYNKDEGTFGKYGANIFALKMGLDESMIKRVVDTVSKDIEQANGHLDTGIFGTRYLFEVLCEYGLNEQAYEIINQTTFPSIGHWIAQGATTTWEQWDGVHSRNHPMFGGGLVWLYRDLAGMKEAKPGYKQIIFKPCPTDDLGYASYSKLTPYGEAGIWWEKIDNQIEIKVKVPVGSSALIYVPHNPSYEMKLHKEKNVVFKSKSDGYICYEIGSGEYKFYGSL